MKFNPNNVSSSPSEVALKHNGRKARNVGNPNLDISNKSIE
jgi:hypothetical protein